jgi:hypothetical protein
MDSVPHLALPLRLQGDHYASVQQDTLSEVQATVACIVAFPLGTRIEAPDFGVPELEFTQRPLDTLALAQAIRDNEPRAAVTVSEQSIPGDPLGVRVRVAVALPGESEEVI